MQDGKVRMSRSWLMYDKGGNSWVLAGDDGGLGLPVHSAPQGLRHP